MTEQRNKLQASKDKIWLKETNSLRGKPSCQKDTKAKQKNLSISHGTSRGQLLSQEIQSFPSAENHAKTSQFTESEEA